MVAAPPTVTVTTANPAVTIDTAWQPLPTAAPPRTGPPATARTAPRPTPAKPVTARPVRLPASPGSPAASTFPATAVMAAPVSLAEATAVGRPVPSAVANDPFVVPVPRAAAARSASAATAGVAVEADAATPEVPPAPRLNPRTMPELSAPGWIADPGAAAAPPIVGPEPVGRHLERFTPPSVAKPRPVAPAVPLENKLPPRAVDVNEREDDRVFSSRLTTDSSVYANYVDHERTIASRKRGFFYEQNFHYDLYDVQTSGSSLQLLLDTTLCNDTREYPENFTLGHISLESRTPMSRLVLGHAHPELSPMTCNQRILGFYGEQQYANTAARAGVGYLALEKEDLENPRKIGMFRLQHRHDEAVTIGLNAVTTRDDRSYPSSTFDTPTIGNRVYSLDCQVKPTANIFANCEVANSLTELDRRAGDDERAATAYRALVGYQVEKLRVSGGVEQAGTGFYTVAGESARDTHAYFGTLDYTLNRFISTNMRTRLSRSNQDGGARPTLVRTTPEVTVRVKPAEKYPHLECALFYQPAHDYSDNGNWVDRRRTWTRFDVNQKAGAFNWNARLSNIIDRDDITFANDRNINGLDLKLGWKYDAEREFYGLTNFENFEYRSTGGFDRFTTFGCGGRSLFHQDVSLNLEFTRRIDDLSAGNVDSTHDRMNFVLTKEYNNEARFSLEFEGTDHRFAAGDRNFMEASGRLRYTRFF